MIEARLKTICLMLVLILFATACAGPTQTPNPLLGKWKSSDGNSINIQFFDDGKVSWAGLTCNYLVTGNTHLEVGCNGIDSSGEYRIDGDTLTISTGKNSLVFERVKQ